MGNVCCHDGTFVSSKAPVHMRQKQRQRSSEQPQPQQRSMHRTSFSSSTPRERRRSRNNSVLAECVEAAAERRGGMHHIDMVKVHSWQRAVIDADLSWSASKDTIEVGPTAASCPGISDQSISLSVNHVACPRRQCDATQGHGAFQPEVASKPKPLVASTIELPTNPLSPALHPKQSVGLPCDSTPTSTTRPTHAMWCPPPSTWD